MIKYFRWHNKFTLIQAKLFAQLEDSLARGNEVITIDSRVSFAWTEEVLVKLASYFSEYSFKITIENSKDPLLAVFDNIPVDQQEAIKGYIISKDLSL